MKHTLLIITALLFITSTVIPQSKMNINNLVEYGDKKYKPNDDEPYTGKVFDFYENGQKKLDGNYRNGLMNRKWMYYHENGQIHAQGRFIDGDGSNPSESSGIPFNGRSGRWSFWYENGQKSSEDNYKDGKGDGKWTMWHKNGQKSGEGTYKDGELDGKWTTWYENGQKWEEGTSKDGEEIERTYWDEDENETEPLSIVPPGKVWSPERSSTRSISEPPGPAPPGKVWSQEHGHWHDAPVIAPSITPQSSTKLTSEPPGPAPPGKVWSPEHGHWHDAP